MTNEIIIVAAICVIAALVAGILIGQNLEGSTNKDGSDELAAAKKELAEYKSQVSDHFGKTADLVDNLTESYKDVFDHLGDSAKSLMTEEQVKQHLSSRAAKAVTLTYIAEEVKADSEVEATTEIEKEAIAEVKPAESNDTESNETVEEKTEEVKTSS